MHIDARGEIAGFPILRVRRLLRQLPQFFTVVDVCDFLNVSDDHGTRIVESLEGMNYIQRISIDEWELAAGGFSFVNASAAKPIKRATADRLLKGVLSRANKVNADPYFLYRVNRIAVFGSYLTTAMTLSDLDLAIDVARKEPEEAAYRALVKGRAGNLRADIGSPRNTVERVLWPCLEVFAFIKGRSRVVSVHEYHQLAALSGRYRKIDFARLPMCGLQISSSTLR